MHFTYLLTAALVGLAIGSPLTKSTEEKREAIERRQSSGREIGCSPGGYGPAAGCSDASNPYCSCVTYQPQVGEGDEGTYLYSCYSSSTCPYSDKMKREVEMLTVMKARSEKELAGTLAGEKKVRDVQKMRK